MKIYRVDVANLEGEEACLIETLEFDKAENVFDSIEVNSFEHMYKALSCIDDTNFFDAETIYFELA